MANFQPMKPPSQDERLQIWRYTYARQSFFEARTAAKLLYDDATLSCMAKDASVLATLKSALTCQVVIAYVRPFTESRLTHMERRGKPLVPAGAVPPLLKKRHQSLMNMRHQAIGHKDATAFPDIPFNKVFVKSLSDSIEIHTAPVGGIEPRAIREVIRLCERLICYCQDALEPFCRKYMCGAHKPPVGVYVMSTDESPGSWLKRLS